MLHAASVGNTGVNGWVPSKLPAAVRFFNAGFIPQLSWLQGWRDGSLSGGGDVWDMHGFGSGIASRRPCDARQELLCERSGDNSLGSLSFVWAG